jgi:hypothetical protein
MLVLAGAGTIGDGIAGTTGAGAVALAGAGTTGGSTTHFGARRFMVMHGHIIEGFITGAFTITEDYIETALPIAQAEETIMPTTVLDVTLTITV